MSYVHNLILTVPAANRTRGRGRPAPSGDRGRLPALLSETAVHPGLIGRNRHRRATLLTCHNDCLPHVDLLTVDFSFRLVGSHFLPIPAVRPEQLLESMKPLSNCPVGTLHERFDFAVREAIVIQERRQDTLLCRRSLRENPFC
jgi:hypothetical protein